MISINYQSYGTNGFNLRLRFYQDGETRYVAVNRLLRGGLQKRHWNQRKQMFVPSAPFSDENNAILAEFRRRYESLALDWHGSLYGLLHAAEHGAGNEGLRLCDLVERIIGEQMCKRHSDGTVKGSYEGYQKIGKRLEEYCSYRRISYGELLVSDIGAEFVNGMMDWVVNVRGGRGHVYISSMLHAVLMRAARDGEFDMSRVRYCRWKKKNKASVQKYHTLSVEQCRRFLSLSADELPRGQKSMLYWDFCVFILYTGQSVCDAVSLRYDDVRCIGGVEHFVFKRRKIAEKQGIPCAVPINERMRGIMEKYRSVSRDGYVFPIRNDYKLKNQRTNNGDIKHFISLLNIWLKKVGVILGCDFSLHSYTFRHTAITHYLSRDVPVVYVANLMGTSVKNCENIYYNNEGDVLSRDKVLGALEF